MKKNLEIEQKYRIASPVLIRKKLRALKAQRICSGHETNHLFDLGGMLKRRKSVLRLRRSVTGGFLTFKGPRMKSSFKKRIEIETRVDFFSTRELLAALGFKLSAQYEKKREEYRLGRAHVVIDQLSGFGWFAEIEGSEKEILKIEKQLGLGAKDREKRSYLEMIYGKKEWR